MNYLSFLNKLLIASAVILILTLFMNLQGQPEMNQPHPDMQRLLHDLTVENWELFEENYYNRDNLFDYINGGAELYLSYGFQGLITRLYQRGEQPDIIVDVFDMGTSPNAYGIFSHSCEQLSNEIGQGSQYTMGLLQFWKNRYYVSILASPETDESKETIFKIARVIEKRIETEGALPTILDYLPKEKLLPASIRYFKHHAWQNTYYFITAENIFNITSNTEAVLAKYQDLGILMLIEYPREEDASVAQDNFIRYFAPEDPIKKVVRIEDGTWTGERLSGNLLIIVFDAPEEAAVHELLNAIE